MKPSGVWATTPIRPPGSGDAGELAGRPLLVRREHRAEDRADDIEAAVLERQRLGVAFDELDREALGIGAPAGALEQARNVVDADDVAAPPGGGQGGIAAAGGDVEDALGRMHVERLDEELGHDLDLGRRSCGSRHWPRSPAGAS